MNYISDFFAGAFLCNSLPHILCGLQGAPFPSPFSKPRGVGDSSPLVNFLWGFLNLLIGLALLTWHPISATWTADTLVFGIGFLAIGIQLSLHFGKVQKDKKTDNPKSSC